MSFDIEFDLIRLGCAFFAGVLFSISGSFTQLVSENDLASPSTFGFDALAILFLMINYLIVSFGISNEYILFFSLIFCVFFLFLLKNIKLLRKIKTKELILIGLAFNLLVGSIFSVIQFLFIALNFQFPTDLWFGGFRFAQSHHFITLAISSIVLYSFILKERKYLALMSISKKLAGSVSLRSKSMGLLMIMLSLMITVLLVSYFGVFSFVALIFPHILRQIPFFKSSFRREIIYGPVLGGVLLMLLDLFSLSFVVLGAEVPTGMLSSIAGSFIFIFLLIKSQYKGFAKY